MALVPAAAADLVNAGHGVYIETNAGIKSGFSDEDYTSHGVKSVKMLKSFMQPVKWLLKLKSRLPVIWNICVKSFAVLLFAFGSRAGIDWKVTGNRFNWCGFETVEEADGSLPLLAPRWALLRYDCHSGWYHLLTPTIRWKGVLLVVYLNREEKVVNAGAAGGNSAALAAKGGANVLFSIKTDRLAEMMERST